MTGGQVSVIGAGTTNLKHVNLNEIGHILQFCHVSGDGFTDSSINPGSTPKGVRLSYPTPDDANSMRWKYRRGYRGSTSGGVDSG